MRSHWGFWPKRFSPVCGHGRYADFQEKEQNAHNTEVAEQKMEVSKLRARCACMSVRVRVRVHAGVCVCFRRQILTPPPFTARPMQQFVVGCPTGGLVWSRCRWWAATVVSERRQSGTGLVGTVINVCGPTLILYQVQRPWWGGWVGGLVDPPTQMGGWVGSVSPPPQLTEAPYNVALLGGG